MRFLTCLPACLAVGAAGGAQAMPVLAQLGPAPADKPWLATVIALVLVVGALVASLMSSKRGHKD